MTEKEKEQWAVFQKALKICKQDELKDRLKDSYIKFLEGILERLDEKKDIMTEETIHVTER